MDEYEYSENIDSSGIKRARTGCLDLVELQKKDFLDKISVALDGSSFVGLYLLINSDSKKIYIGESSDGKNRIKQHIKKSPVDGFEFDRIVIVWDGRPMITTRFGDETFRKSIEKECINVIDKEDFFPKYESINTVKEPKETNIYEKSSIERLKNELFFLLCKFLK